MELDDFVRVGDLFRVSATRRLLSPPRDLIMASKADCTSSSSKGPRGAANSVGNLGLPVPAGAGWLSMVP